MKYMLQLQNRDVSSYRGLCIDVRRIEAVLPCVTVDKNQEAKVVGCTIHMNSGKIWNVAQNVSEVLEMIDQYNEDYKMSITK